MDSHTWRGLYIVLYYGLYNIYTTNYRLYFMAYIYYILMMLLLIPKCQTDQLSKHNSAKCIWHQKGSLTIAKIIYTRNKKSISRRKTNFTCSLAIHIKYPDKYIKWLQTATTIQNNFPQLEACTKNIAAKMADSEFQNKNKIESKLTNKNTKN